MSEGLIRPVAVPFSGTQPQPDTTRADYWRSRDAIVFTGRRAADPQPPTVEHRLDAIEGSVDALGQTVDEVAVRVTDIEALQHKALGLLFEIQALAARVDAEIAGRHDAEDLA